MVECGGLQSSWWAPSFYSVCTLFLYSGDYGFACAWPSFVSFCLSFLASWATASPPWGWVGLLLVYHLGPYPFLGTVWACVVLF